MIVQLLTEHHLEFLSLKGGCRGSSESTHVTMPHCWKSHYTVHLSLRGLFWLFWVAVLHRFYCTSVCEKYYIHVRWWVEEAFQFFYNVFFSVINLFYRGPFGSSLERQLNQSPTVSQGARNIIWAVTRDFQKCGILTSVDSNEPVQPPFKLRNCK